jgi:hypothetical protein
MAPFLNTACSSVIFSLSFLKSSFERPNNMSSFTRQEGLRTDVPAVTDRQVASQRIVINVLFTVRPRTLMSSAGVQQGTSRVQSRSLVRVSSRGIQMQVKAVEEVTSDEYNLLWLEVEQIRLPMQTPRPISHTTTSCFLCFADFRRLDSV